MNKKDGVSNPCMLVIGEWQAVREKVMEAAAKFLGTAGTDAITIVRGDEVTESQVIEALRTRGIFSGKKVIIYRDPDFLIPGKKSRNPAAMIKQAMDSGRHRRAARLLGRLLGKMDIMHENLQGLSGKELRDMTGATGLTPEEIEGLFRHYHEDIRKNITPSAHSGKGLLSYIKKTKDPHHLLIIQLSEIGKENPLSEDFLKTCTVADMRLSRGKGKGSTGKPTHFIEAVLSDMGKEMERAALDEFVRLVGASSLSALKNELEKLASLMGEKKRITREDVLSLVVRHREEEIYRLTDAFLKRDMGKSILSLHLLMNQNVHPLAILAALRNSIIKMYALKAVAQAASVSSGLRFNQFSSACWPVLKKTLSELGANSLARIHPYSAYLHLTSPHPIEGLIEMIEELPDLDLALKGSKLDPHFVLENFFFKHMS